MTIAKLKKVQTLEQLEALGLQGLTYDVGGRGGHVGFHSDMVAEQLKVKGELPRKIGAYTNYLGGGVRGSILRSENNLFGKKGELIDALVDACVRVYMDIENEAGLNEDEEDDWDAKATRAARAAGISSAY